MNVHFLKNQNLLFVSTLNNLSTTLHKQLLYTNKNVLEDMYVITKQKGAENSHMQEQPL